MFCNKKIKKLKSLILLIFGLLLIVLNRPISTLASEPVNLYLFYGDGCPHCAKEREFLNEIKNEDNSQIIVHEFEVYYNDENVNHFNNATENLGITVAGVPCLIIGDEEIVGFGSNETTGEKIRERVDYCQENGCADTTYNIIFNQSEIANQDSDVLGAEIEDNSSKKEELYIPLFNNLDLSELSLPLTTFIIALMDGFNPCAMWILIFLITMLINMKDRKKLYTLGSIFIITSAIVYFVFLAAWFNFFKFMGYAQFIKIIIGIIAIISGVLHLKNALFSKGECHAVSDKKRKSIIDKIKKIIHEKKYSLAIAGIITLAISVNLVEVVCSAGLPSVYTNLLASSNLGTFEYYSYLLFYTLIFMLDDLIIFFIAVKTFEVTGISSKYTKWSSIIGGILILIIGVLLIFKPDALMFG